VIPVYQTLFGEGRGNCGSAVVASILEIPLREVPLLHGGDGTWFQKLWAFLGKYDLQPEVYARQVLPVDAYAYVSGMGPRGWRHACVWWGGPEGKIVHDPHPAGGGLDANNPEVPLWWCVFEPKDPQEKVMILPDQGSAVA